MTFRPGQTVTLGPEPADEYCFRFKLVRIDNSRARPGENEWILLDPTGKETKPIPEVILRLDESQ